eukprot:TRINITY_DN12034_c0_g1_i5.p2 TRINITY_DN12034_c0_g1~~TRINITY_DN12034_c0_g1_i5.p2  ORF type:complete len:376 (+),score=54.66 TRINITY_DN12034_c0_g1_i5:239-1366(+)
MKPVLKLPAALRGRSPPPTHKPTPVRMPVGFTRRAAVAVDAGDEVRAVRAGGGGVLSRAIRGVLEARDVRVAATNMEHVTGAEEAVARLQEMAAGCWQAGTVRQRQQLWARFCLWAGRNDLPENCADAAVLFTVATGVSEQGMLAYAKALSGTFRALQYCNDALKVFASTLRAMGAAIPIKKAAPATRDEVEVLVDELRRRGDVVNMAAVMICWKTGSRWGEVTLLRRQHFVVLERTRLVIDWNTLPKTAKAQPSSPARFVEVRGRWVAEICTVLQGVPDFRPWTTNAAEKELVAFPPTQHLSGHSFKRGAMRALLRHAATLPPAEADRFLEAVARLLKHRGRSFVLPDQSIAYGDNCAEELAHLSGTAEVTKVL